MGFSNPVVGGVTLVRPAIQSPNYVPGVSGWSINADGTAEFADVVVRGSLRVEDPPAYVRILGTDEGGNARVIAMHSQDPLSSEWTITAAQDLINGDTFTIDGPGLSNLVLNDAARLSAGGVWPGSGTGIECGLTDVLIRGALTNGSTGYLGQWASWVPAVTQNVAVVTGAGVASYCRIGRLVVAMVYVTLGSNGTAGNLISCSLPVACLNPNAANFPIAGIGGVYDASAPASYLAMVRLRTSTVVDFVGVNNQAAPIGIFPNFGVVAGDILYGLFVYEALI